MLAAYTRSSVPTGVSEGPFPFDKQIQRATRKRSVLVLLSTALLGICLYYFLGAFLLTRRELPYRSSVTDLICRDTHGNSNPSDRQKCVSSDNTSSPGGQLATWRAYLPVGRLVLFIVDGLRYDFLAPQPHCLALSDLQTRDVPSKGTVCSPSYNRVKNMHRMLRKPSNSIGVSKDIYTECPEAFNTSDSPCIVTRSKSILLRYQADAPTVTAQRLRGMFSGSIPAFVEIGTNFNAHVIDEDSVIHQMKQAGKRIVLAGDDTWTKLYPSPPPDASCENNRCNERFFEPGSLPIESFNTQDMDSVDDAIEAWLERYGFLSAPSSSGTEGSTEDIDWDVLIVHWLGVDHIGHTLGAHNEKMGSRLVRMDSIMQRMIDRLTLLSDPAGDGVLVMVMGDHGMTDAGQHGGSSSHEADAGLFLSYIDRRMANNSTYTDRSGLFDIVDGSINQSSDPPLQSYPVLDLNQVDLVPWLSAMCLNRSPPYSNIGISVPNSPNSASSHGTDKSKGIATGQGVKLLWDMLLDDTRSSLHDPDPQSCTPSGHLRQRDETLGILYDNCSSLNTSDTLRAASEALLTTMEQLRYILMNAMQIMRYFSVYSHLAPAAIIHSVFECNNSTSQDVKTNIKLSKSRVMSASLPEIEADGVCGSDVLAFLSIFCHGTVVEDIIQLEHAIDAASWLLNQASRSKSSSSGSGSEASRDELHDIFYFVRIAFQQHLSVLFDSLYYELCVVQSPLEAVTPIGCTRSLIRIVDNATQHLDGSKIAAPGIPIDRVNPHMTTASTSTSNDGRDSDVHMTVFEKYSVGLGRAQRLARRKWSQIDLKSVRLVAVIATCVALFVTFSGCVGSSATSLIRGLYLEIRQLFVEFYTGSSSDRKRNIAILVLLVAIDISLVVVFCVTPLSDNLIASELYVSGALTLVSVLLAFECRDIIRYDSSHTLGSGGEKKASTDPFAPYGQYKYSRLAGSLGRFPRTLILTAFVGIIGSHARVPIQYTFNVAGAGFTSDILRAAVFMGVLLLCYIISTRKLAWINARSRSNFHRSQDIVDDRNTSRCVAMKIRAFIASVLRITSIILCVCAQIAILLHWSATHLADDGINFAEVAITISLISMATALLIGGIGGWMPLSDKRCWLLDSSAYSSAALVEPWMHVVFHFTSALVLFGGPRHVAVFVLNAIGLVGFGVYFSIFDPFLDDLHAKQSHVNSANYTVAIIAADHPTPAANFDHHEPKLGCSSSPTNVPTIVNVATAFAVIGLSRFVFLSSNQRLSLTDVHLSVGLIGAREGFDRTRAGFQLFTHILGPNILSLIAIKMCSATRALALKGSSLNFPCLDVWCVLHTIVLVKAWLLALSFVCAAVLDQHLMMWAIFAPKILFECGFWVTDLAFIICIFYVL